MNELKQALLKALSVYATFSWQSKSECDVFDLDYYGVKPEGYPEYNDIKNITWDMVYDLVDGGYLDDEITEYDEMGPCERYFKITKKGIDYVIKAGLV